MAWLTTWVDRWRDSLSAALQQCDVRLGPTANVEPNRHDTAVIVCVPDRTFVPSSSPTGARRYSVRLYLGVVIRGMDDADSVDDLHAAMDAVEAAVWALLAPGAFRALQGIDEVTSVTIRVLTARTGAVEINLLTEERT